MSTLPSKQSELLEFAALHADVWDGSPTTIGLTAAAVVAIKNAHEVALNNYNDTLAARENSKAATLTSDVSFDNLRNLLSDAVRAIRFYAESTNNPLVYSSAQIPAPAMPTPALPPTQPTDVRAAIEPSGALTLSWKASPSSTGFDASTKSVVYTIMRRLSTTGTFVPVGVANAARNGKRGTSMFTDQTLPHSAASGPIQYMITCARAISGTSLVGPDSNVFNVMLGVGSGGGGFSIASQGEENGGSNMKMAA